MHIFNKMVYLLLAVIITSSHALAQQTGCFFVEGATGVGKTTFVQLLKNNLPDVAIVYEPVESFTNVHGAGNILELFFSDPKRWTFTTNIYITLMHAQAAKQSMNTAMMIVDRSLYADCYVYGKMACETGMISALEWNVYKDFFMWITNNNAIKPCGFIYLKAPAQVVLRRVQQRDRIEEKDLPLQYQINQERYYNEWFIEKKDIAHDIAQIPVLIIDATQNFKDDCAIQEKCLNDVKEFIVSSQNS
ncbi:MAG TPA: deoxynucleoside kinase [Candidatus Babeliales bacterium]|nr:deoxynucleoside kinase [Candidatus Babeliales bacterium]